MSPGRWLLSSIPVPPLSSSVPPPPSPIPSSPVSRLSITNVMVTSVERQLKDLQVVIVRSCLTTVRYPPHCCLDPCLSCCRPLVTLPLPTRFSQASKAQKWITLPYVARKNLDSAQVSKNTYSN